MYLTSRFNRLSYNKLSSCFLGVLLFLLNDSDHPFSVKLVKSLTSGHILLLGVVLPFSNRLTHGGQQECVQRIATWLLTCHGPVLYEIRLRQLNLYTATRRLLILAFKHLPISLIHTWVKRARLQNIARA